MNIKKTLLIVNTVLISLSLFILIFIAIMISGLYEYEINKAYYTTTKTVSEQETSFSKEEKIAHNSIITLPYYEESYEIQTLPFNRKDIPIKDMLCKQKNVIKSQIFKSSSSIITNNVSTGKSSSISIGIPIHI